MLRTLGGRNIGKCRLRAHQHPLCRHCRTAVESLWSPSPCKTPKARCVLERVLGDVLRMHAEDRLLPASILDFRAKLENQCKVFPVYTLVRASILDFRARLGNRCKVSPVYTLLRASILDFRPKLENRCRGEWFRLLQPSRTQAGTGCHEGGIILSKKPPEWHLSLPQQRSASDSILRCGKGE